MDGNNEKIKEPNMPAYVLLGLTFVIFFPPKVFPKIYPPMSENIPIRINQKNNITLITSLPLRKYAKITVNIININPAIVILFIFFLFRKNHSLNEKIKIINNKKANKY